MTTRSPPFRGMPTRARPARRRGGPPTRSPRPVELAVDRRPDDRAFQVRTPDGLVEDLGTTFSLDVANGATEALRVTSGEVVFRRPRHPDVHLRAGESWTVAPPVTAPPAPPGP